VGDENSFGVHEVYYDAAGFPTSYSEDPQPVTGDTPEELRESLHAMMRALDKEVLTPADFGIKED